MKRRIKQLLLVLMLGLFAWVGWGLVWLTSTTDGARWILQAISTHTDVHISARAVQGTLVDNLVLAGVNLRFAEIEVDVDSAELQLSLASIATRKIEVRSSILKGVSIQNHTPRSKEPIVLNWPKVSGIIAWVGVRIARLQVSPISYRRLNDPPLVIADVAISAQWQNGELRLDEFAIASQAGTLTGKVMAGFRQPALQGDLLLSLPQPVAQMDRYSAQVRMVTGDGAEQIAGLIKITGATGPDVLWRLDSTAGMTREVINLRGMTLTQTGVDGRITGDGSLNLSGIDPTLTLNLKGTQLDLGPALDVSTDLSGTLNLTGNLENFRGHFSLVNQGATWRAASFASAFEGNRAGVHVGPITGNLLDGSLQGQLDIHWLEGLDVQGELLASALNPARLDPSWRGVVNLRLGGALAQSSGGSMRSELTATLLQSHLHGQALTGALRFRTADQDFLVDRLKLLGKGFAIEASGQLDRRLAVAADISDLSLLVPGSTGTVHSAGWVRWRDGNLAGNLSGRVSDLMLGDAHIESGDIRARTEGGKGGAMAISASIQNVLLGRMKADALNLKLNGTVGKHTAEVFLRGPRRELQLSLSGAYGQDRWQGTVRHLTGSDKFGSWQLAAPVQVKVDSASLFLSPLALVGAGSERIDLAADLRWKPLSGTARLEWGLNLARVGVWLDDTTISGFSQGRLRAGFPTDNRLNLSGQASAQGSFTWQGQSLKIARSEVHLEAGEQGMAAGFSVHLNDGGEIQGRLDSAAPAHLGLPDEGKVTMDWQGINLSLLRPWLPQSLHLTGTLNGSTQGELAPDNQLRLAGDVHVNQGHALWTDAFGEISSALNQASASWVWQGDSLRGNLELELAENGRVQGNFQVPIPARLPVAADPLGSLQAVLVGKVQENGLLTALFPGVLQESHGDLEARLSLSGSWASPLVGGELQLAKAGAYLPSAGIRIKDVQLAARLDKDAINIETFRAVSGDGRIEGRGRLHLNGWRVASYEGTLSGDRFETIHLPEIQVLSAPNFTFQGTPEKLTVRGELRIPELQVLGTQSRSVVLPNEDVIVLGQVPAPPRASLLALDVQINLVLGDKVQINLDGIDVQLGGALELGFDDINKISSKGEIRVVKGTIKTYNVNLDIVRGRIFYGGGPIDQPTLDFLALRTINEVKAGVTVGGTLQAPLIKLYSEPAMPEVDVLGYIVIGHPISNGEQAGIASKAASMLLSAGQLGELNSQLQNRLGISAGITAESRLTSSTMGYAPIQTNAPGYSPSAQASTEAEAMLTVGKYLAPNFYVSYGKSLSTGSNLVRMRYDLSKRWQVESQSGDESGLDVYYKIELK